MKIAFITNDISYYGASRSLKTLIGGINELNSKQEVEIHLIVPKRLKNRNDFNYLSEWFGIPRNRIYEFSLPFYNNYKGNRSSFFHRIFNLRWRLFSNKLYGFLKCQNFDFVHLNSLTLIDVSNKDFKFILHVREIINEFKDKLFVQSRLNQSNKVIFIDFATANAFNSFNLPQNVILNNPFSMLHLKTILPSKELEVLTEISNKKKIFALIGKIHEEKGSEFIVKVFNKCDTENIVLIIKGGGEVSYINYIKSIAGPNVLFLEESPDVENIYKTADYIIRGENYPCIGRTTFEALYSGIGVVLPGDITYYRNNVSEFEVFEDDIYTYSPRDEDSLLSMICNVAKREGRDRVLLSNTNEYISSFLNFISNENVVY